MDDSSLMIQDKLSNFRSYNKWIKSVFDGYYGREILDIGSSIGNIAKLIIEDEKPQRFTSVEMNPKAVEHLKECFSGVPGFNAVNADILDFESDKCFDTVCCFNVLEHIPDDKKVLDRVHELLKPSGHLLLLVPAHMRLWGSLDELDGHLRRYGRKDLTEKLSKYRIEKMGSFNLFGILSWMIASKTTKKGTFPSRRVIWAMDKLVFMLRGMESIIHPPFGQSIYAVARKI